MRYKIIVSATVWCLIASHAAHGQKKVYSLSQVWQKTLQQYPSTLSKKYQREQQQLNKELIKKERLPEINVQSQLSYGSYQGVSGAFFPLPGIYNVSGNDRGQNTNTISNAYTSAVLQWNFLQFGKVKANLKVADAAIAVSNRAQTQEEFHLMLVAAQQYFTVLHSSASLQIAKADVGRLQYLLELSEAQAEAGLKPGADTLLVKANYYQLKGRVNEQKATLETAMLNLAALINEDVNSFTVDTSHYHINNPGKALVADDSLNNHPYLKYLQANTNYSKASREAVKRMLYPSIGLLAGTGIRGAGIDANGVADNGLFSPQKNNTTGYLIGVGMTWNLSSLYQNRVKQKIVEKEIAIANSNYEESVLQLRTSYQAAVDRWRQQMEKVSDSRIALHASVQAYDLYLTRYESGLINLIELLQLQKTLQDAESIYVNAKGDYWDELINQSASIGNLSFLLKQLNH